jgi:CRP-like cAMP-binding protein
MKAKKDDINASIKRRGKPRRQPVTSSSEAVQLEALDFETGELSAKLRTAPSLKPTPLLPQSIAKRLSKRQLMKLAEKPDELSYLSTAEIIHQTASHTAYLNLDDLVDASDGSDTAAEAVIERVSKTQTFTTGEVVRPSRNTRQYLAILRRGSVKIVFEYKFLQYKPIHILIKRIGPGTIFGNMDIWGQNFSKVTAIATQPCEVAFLDSHGADALVESSTTLSLRLFQIMGPKFYEVQQWEFQRLCKKWGYEPKGWKAETES